MTGSRDPMGALGDELQAKLGPDVVAQLYDAAERHGTSRPGTIGLFVSGLIETGIDHAGETVDTRHRWLTALFTSIGHIAAKRGIVVKATVLKSGDR